MEKFETTDLNNIRYLIEAADSGSFSAAARHFGVPPSLVSRRIAKLEEDVGSRLFQRTTRSLKLTDAGQVFLAHARVGIDALSQAHALLGDTTGVLSGRVRITAPVGTATALWVTTARFLASHPEVRVEFAFNDRYVDLVEERFDMALRSGPEIRTDKLVGRRLVSSSRQLFASPAYLKKHGTPRAVRDLRRHACVILGPHVDRVTWHLHVGKRLQNVVVQGRVAVNEATVAAACVASGFGIGFLPGVVCEKHVAAGSLVRVLPRADAGEIGMWLVYPDRHLPPASRALVEFLVRELPANLLASKPG